MDLGLSGKRVLVCGASKGIGLAIAEAFSQEGCRLVLVARDKALLDERTASLKGTGHTAFQADLSRQDQVDLLIDYLAVNPVDIVINNTGGPPPGPLVDASLDDFQEALQMHLFTSHSIMKAVLQQMKESRYGRFINIISTSVKVPIKGLGVSNTTRGAMASWAKTLSNEVAPFGITVNNILPGAISTGRLTGIIANGAERSGKSEAEVAADMRSTIPAGRFGDPSELGSLAVFLASDRAGYITGVSIPVDGGRTGAL